MQSRTIYCNSNYNKRMKGAAAGPWGGQCALCGQLVGQQASPGQHSTPIGMSGLAATQLLHRMQLLPHNASDVGIRGHIYDLCHRAKIFLKIPSTVAASPRTPRPFQPGSDFLCSILLQIYELLTYHYVEDDDNMFRSAETPSSHARMSHMRTHSH